MKNFLSILSGSIATTLLATSFSPAQAFTWDDLWGVVKSLQESPPQQAASTQESPASSSDPSNTSNNTSPP